MDNDQRRRVDQYKKDVRVVLAELRRSLSEAAAKAKAHRIEEHEGGFASTCHDCINDATAVRMLRERIDALERRLADYS